MTDSLNESDRTLLRAPNFAHLATIRPDGTPQVSVVWVDAEGDHVLVNSATGRVKDRNIARDPRVAVSAYDQSNPYSTVTVDGIVESTVVGDDALAHIDALSRAYTGKAWSAVEGQERVIYRIRPTRIVRHA